MTGDAYCTPTQAFYAVMTALVNYPWPGNVRELQNLIERSVILTDGNVLCLPFEKFSWTMENGSPEPITLEDAERTHICKALKCTNGIIGGPKGAADRLGVKRATLYSRMEKLGISR